MRCARAAVAAFLTLGAMLVQSCASPSAESASIWTDAPDLALAVEIFNGSQDKHSVELRWEADLARAIRSAKRPPSVAVGRRLKGSSVRSRFRPLDYLFDRGLVDRESFYKEILALGISEGRQQLIPLSFNLPAIVFAKNAAPAGDGFTIALGDMAPPSLAFSDVKAGKGGPQARMGFSPRWDPEFLTLAVATGGASFKQGKGELSWDDDGLGRAIEEIRAWSSRVDGSAAAADDYQFKYLYAPAYQYLREGRALFAYISSSDFFLVPEDKRSDLDFRWFASGGRVPVCDDVAYLAIAKDAPGRAASEAFVAWLLGEEGQASILDLAKRSRAMESHFGVAGGFSSVRAVNERLFARYYPSLLGHTPPAAALAAPPALPEDWEALKADVLGPWLLEATASSSPSEEAGAELSAHLAEYRKKGARLK